MDIEYVTLFCSCLCTAATHEFTVPSTFLPLPSHLCNCTTSRRISGSLVTSYVNVTHPRLFADEGKNPDLSALTAYPSSDILTRWFCSTCGTHMYLEYHADGHFEVATGTLRIDGNMKDFVEFKSCMWIGDTRDGGASYFIERVNGTALQRYLQEPVPNAQVPLDWKSSTASSISSAAEKQPVLATCHCAGVQFFVTSPDNPALKTTSTPYPDLLIPYHQGPNASANPENYPWWLSGASKDRYLAGTCACTTCRRASGVDITFWAFVPTVNIFLDKECTVPFTRGTGDGRKYWGSLRAIRSSSNVTRAFCEKCGANVFWDGDERPSIVDVAVGLLDAKSGARAEELLAWWPGRVSFEEDAMNKELIRGLGEGLKSWRDRNDEK